MRPFREMNSLVVGVVGTAVLVGGVGVAFNAESMPIIGAGPEYHAEFAEAAGLKPQDEVRVAGVKVGKVTDLELAGDRVRVTMRLKGVDLGDETRADIKVKTVLGRKFVMLTSEGDDELDEGSTIPLERTSSPYDVTAAFQGLATTVEGIDEEQLAEAFTTLADAFRDTPDDVRRSLEGLSRLSRTVASRDAELKRLLDRSRGVSRVLAERDQDLVAFLDSTSLVLQEVRRRREAIDALLASTIELSRQLTALVRENRAQLKPALDRLNSVVDLLEENQENLEAAIPRMAAFTRLFANNLGNGRWFDTLVDNLTSVQEFQPGPWPSGNPAPRGGAR